MSEARQENDAVTQADYDYAVGLFNEEKSTDEIRKQLVARGVSEEAADGVIRDLLLQSVYAMAASLFNEGLSPDEVKQKLTDRGLSSESATVVVDDIVARQRPGAQPSDPGKTIFLKVAGGFVFAVGAVLFIGNITGFLRTFPLAGYLTMAVGGAIYGAGQKTG